MIDLSSRAGLPMYLDGERLVFDAAVVVRESKTRTRGELEPVARDPSACVPGEAVQYRMWNDVARAQDVNRLHESAVQYELTLLSPRALGDEKSKTLGHVHNAIQTPSVSAAAGVGISQSATKTLGVYAPTFSEIFEVLHGTAHFVFFALDETKTRATFCGVTEADVGAQLVCPPDLYHLTINAGTEPLLFADLISRRAHGSYETVKALRGAPYYELKINDWVRNKTLYETTPLVKYDPPQLNLGGPLYTQFVLDPASFQWLDDPLAFEQKFP